jgi:excisionase family DNA binding protein
MAREVSGSKGRPIIALDSGEINTTTAAGLLGVSSRHILALIHARDLPAYRNNVHGKELAHWVLLKQDVLDFSKGLNLTELRARAAGNVNNNGTPQRKSQSHKTFAGDRIYLQKRFNDRRTKLPD